MMALAKARDIGLRIAKESLDKDNCFIDTVKSGSKGDFFNIAQVTGLLSQQAIVGKRVGKMLNNGERSLVSYPLGNPEVSDEIKYESHGFIRSSFMHGLNPSEFFWHAMSGREGMTDTATGTAKSGYLQRRIIKCMEDVIVRADGTVRSACGHILSIVYGEDGFDAGKLVKVDGKMEFCDVRRIMDMLVMDLENEDGEWRELTDCEMDELVSFIRPSPKIPVETAEFVAQHNKERILRQIRGVETAPEILPELRQILEHKYFTSMIAAGEPVGILTAQSIGEFQTQQMLNTFHKAGLSEKTVVQGVPRFTELLNATQKPKAVTYDIYFKDHNQSLDDLRSALGHSLRELTINDVYRNIRISSDVIDRPWKGAYEILHGSVVPYHTVDEQLTTISINLDRDVLYEFGLSCAEMCERIEEGISGSKCMASPYGDVLDVIVAHPPGDEWAVVQDLELVSLCGIRGVREIFYSKTSDGEWFVQSDGTDFSAVLAHPLVDPYRTKSNNPWDIYEVLGIGATNQFLIDELYALMPNINYCHIKVLVEKMTFTGTITAISRYSMRKEESGPLGKASFEETLKNFLEAGVFCSEEPTVGVSSSIICGKLGAFGTGATDVLMDFEKLKAEGPMREGLCASVVRERGTPLVPTMVQEDNKPRMSNMPDGPAEVPKSRDVREGKKRVATAKKAPPVGKKALEGKVRPDLLAKAEDAKPVGERKVTRKVMRKC